MAASYRYKGYVIRERERRCASPKEWERQWWIETQVVLGRSVLARFDFAEQAERWIDARIAAEAS
jgi:hypothetical protein